MIDFLDYIYIGLYVLLISVLKEIIEYVFITRRGGNVITIETNATKSSTKTNEIGTNTRFAKKKGGKDNKVVEDFLDCPDSSSPINNLAGPIDSAIPNCDRATWLFCDDNFEKLSKLLNLITFNSNYNPNNHRITLDASLFVKSVILQGTGTGTTNTLATQEQLIGTGT